MLKRFRVFGFKNFREECEVDFSKVRDYDFNKELIKNGLINKVLLYGKNGSGKSNLGLAIMDITIHLTDNVRDLGKYLFVLNGDTPSDGIFFEYTFQFAEDEVIYSYHKRSDMALLDEKIVVNGKNVFEYDYRTNRFTTTLSELTNLNRDVLRSRNLGNSVIKTIYGFSAHLPENSPIKRIYEFACGMLLFRSLGHYEFMGMTNLVGDVEQFITQDKGVLERFRRFLSDCGLEYRFTVVSGVMGRQLYAQFENQNYPFFQIASTGTLSLALFFYWMEKTKGHLTFLFLDEYDAFYHFNLSQIILKTVNADSSYQSIVTTHNPYLADNSIMRPDCYLNLKDGKVKSFADSTTRKIRQGNSLEKMVLSDAF
ncbi:MAG: AAA family ATPase [Bacilli bacterium]|nr:AAA family ATPase [Bacilli bacterium]